AERRGRDEMLVEGADAAAADEPEQVQRAAPLLDPGAQLHERGQAEEVARLDGLRDARDILRDHATGAEVQVTHLAVADLAVGKPHGESGRVEEGARRPAPEAMPGGRIAQLGGVALAAGAKAPALRPDQADEGRRPAALSP